VKTINTGFEEVPLQNLKMHPRNVNQGDFGAIQESIEGNGFFGAITANKRTGHILAGNHRYKVAKEQHAATIPVIWVDVDEQQELRILLADNRTARLGHDDENALAALLSELSLSDDGLKGTGFDGDDLDEIIGRMAGGVGEAGGVEEPDGGNYSRKIEAPTYVPTQNEPPAIGSLSKVEKYEALLEKIGKTDIPGDVRQFLKIAATRHIVFDYAQIAEFYAHASADVQELFEDSALVIIDFNKAIEQGFVTMTESLRLLIPDADDSEEDEDE
jgi:hypothetical protein